ncbi:MAG: DUF6483 family protein [Muricomes sp.]
MNLGRDYIMRMIKAATAAMTRIVFQKSDSSYEISVEESCAATDCYEQILKMADEGHINEAEEFLYQKLDRANQKCLEMGIGFYDHLNGYEDDFLIKNGYSRDEIGDGIRELLGEYGLEVLEEFVDV